MKKLYIFTGPICCGKTTLASTAKVDRVVSLDEIKEDIFNKYGFLSLDEHKVLNSLARLTFKAQVTMYARMGLSIAVDAEFDSSWREFFYALRADYDYKVVVVNCKTDTFEELWARYEKTKGSRPRCLRATKYVTGIEFEPDHDNREFWECAYDCDKYYLTCGDIVINDKQYKEGLTL